MTTATKPSTNGRITIPPLGTPTEQKLVIHAPKFRVIKVRIRGTAPLVMLPFWNKQAVMDGMEAEKLPGKKTKKPPRNYKKEFEAAHYRTKEGWVGIPATAFRNAMINACRMCNQKMTHAKMSVTPPEETPDG